ncbi:ABC transporter ATP-binding protein [Vibrio parahaemolyticus]|uniref:ABC transporter ATP-binding protein n=1 Tax=Vibrio parahaemolyticus TaxID=670 RepID=UPI00084B01E9|nr:ABC transporter ATP-binding protein [Vibrio parahaemolyticus]EJG1713548.1 ABC transporter ATP-binding protein [Vibrio parahaemolyticus]ODZ54230.1 lipoprotein ABC transporter ATP-binding protein LolD [Vibrio parahaemolyticus]ODZ68377.1 lipoprotein ABC transporter ATP-binding protein LolD [Vibrio parahaemolyticus]OQK32529.1 ABC transporter ATP-binding protein [Vibrio parahaemolyticus]HCG7176097.1 ABC transporter ATP-binding protein [Vibrio parahaemolyticus]
MIVFSQLSRDYTLGSQTVRALQEVSGEVFAGEMVALCGPSGSGKSTLLNVLGMLDSQYQGQVTFAGQPYSSGQMQAAKMRREKLGFIFQKFNLVPVMTALENVAYPLHLNGFSKTEQTELATQMLEHVGLGEFIHHMPDNLSGGQQQRVAIARALVHKPALVIADEPTASLDSQTANKVIDIMKGLGHEFGTTFIVATHDPRMASRCDRTIELVDGKIIQTHASVEEVSWAS